MPEKPARHIILMWSAAAKPRSDAAEHLREWERWWWAAVSNARDRWRRRWVGERPWAQRANRTQRIKQARIRASTTRSGARRCAHEQSTVVSARGRRRQARTEGVFAGVCGTEGVGGGRVVGGGRRRDTRVGGLVWVLRVARAGGREGGWHGHVADKAFGGRLLQRAKEDEKRQVGRGGRPLLPMPHPTGLGRLPPPPAEAAHSSLCQECPLATPLPRPAVFHSLCTPQSRFPMYPTLRVRIGIAVSSDA
ncbi:hypothetical protein C8J57DRAFT_1629473 [Mycena rebaudengoi]|nr:hypothetical protein C8J57DRAFT_1629473 [Mycena rebaudengoi]